MVTRFPRFVSFVVIFVTTTLTCESMLNQYMNMLNIAGKNNVVEHFYPYLLLNPIAVYCDLIFQKMTFTQKVVVKCSSKVFLPFRAIKYGTFAFKIVRTTFPTLFIRHQESERVISLRFICFVRQQ